MKHSKLVNVISNREIAGGIFEMILNAPDIVKQAVPGQFVHIRCNGENTFLRRPISICCVDSDKGWLTIVYQVKGKGTAALTCLKEGDSVNVLGPLGNGFTISDDYERVLLIGGGIGIYPVYNVAASYSKSMKKTAVDSVLGFRTGSLITYEDEFKAQCSSVNIVTDDGSYGRKGTVIPVVEELIKLNKYDMVYVCGPKPMINAVYNLFIDRNINCEVSLEERMGCGVGACLVCTCKVKAKTETGWHHKHVCKDGPVFNMKDVYLD